MEEAFHELADSLFSMLIFMIIIFFIVSLASSGRRDCIITAGAISSRSSSSLALPCDQEPSYLSASDALFDVINCQSDVDIMINGTSIDPAWVHRARGYDEYSLLVLRNIFRTGVWKKVSVLDSSGQLIALEFWKGGVGS